MNIVVSSFLKLFGDFDPALAFSKKELNYIEQHLRHTEEKSSDKRDEWGNWDYQFSKEEVDVPFLDLFVVKKLKEAGIKRKSIWTNGKTFAVCLSHDVDRVESYSPDSFFRNLEKRYANSKSPKERLKLRANIIKTSVKKKVTNKSSDPLWCYEKWVELENQYNYKSSYFFFIRPDSSNLSIYDCDYEISDKMKFNDSFMTVEEYVQTLSKAGFEIGLHGSYHTYDNVSLFNEQKEALEKIIGNPIYCTRQHYLHYDIDKTPEVHIHNNVQIDSTLGFNSNIGFRAGTCFPYFIENDGATILEIPLILMDSALFFNPETTLELAKKKIKSLLDSVENVGGCLTVNFHPDYIINENYFEAYKFLLKEISIRNCEVMSMKEISNLIEKKCVE